MLLLIFILALSISIRAGSCEELQNNKALDEKVRIFLENRKGTWHDWNVPYSDGMILYDLVVKNKYKKAVEIGTSTGLSAIWIAWALSKTGGKLITIEKDWYKDYFTALAPKLEVGACFTAHNATKRPPLSLPDSATQYGIQEVRVSGQLHAPHPYANEKYSNTRHA